MKALEYRFNREIIILLQACNIETESSKLKSWYWKKMEKDDMWKCPMNWLLLNTEHIWDQGLTTYRESSVGQWTKGKKSKH